MTSAPEQAEAPTVDLGIGSCVVPICSHVAYLWETDQEFTNAVGFVETGLRGSDHCVLIGDETDSARTLSVLRDRGLDVDGLLERTRLTVLGLERGVRAIQEQILAISRSAAAGGAPLLRVFGSVGLGRPTAPSNADLVAYEAALTEIAETARAVVLCLAQAPVLDGLLLRRGVLGTHPRLLAEGGVRGNPFFAAQREPLESSGAAREERDALRIAESLIAIFEDTPMMVSFRDPSGRLIRVNREWERGLGWTLAEAQAIDLEAAMFPDPVVRKKVEELIRVGDHPWVDVPTRIRDGTMIETSWARTTLASGTRFSFGQDVTERKRVERETRASELQMLEGQRLSNTGSWAWTPRTGAVSWSQEVFRMFGLGATATQPTMERVLEAVHPDDRSGVEAEMKRASDRMAPLESFFRILRPDGSVRYIHSRGRPVFDDSGKVARFLGAMTDVTERRLSQERLKQSNLQLQALSDRLRVVREQESARIAREVHDEIGQSLSALQMDVAWLTRRVAAPPTIVADADADAVRAKLADMATVIDKTLDSVQRIATELRPLVLDELGLEAAVDWYVHEFASRSGILCRVHIDLANRRIAPDISTAAFRILQEALTNVWRHAGAARVVVDLSIEVRNLRLEVKDDGHGILADRIANAHSLGLLGMQERARAFGGDVVIHGATGQGTRVTVTIPL